MFEQSRNNTNFPLQTYQRLKQKKWDSSDKLRYHQFVVNEYVMSNPKMRGILLFHGMGHGKTMLSVHLAKNIRNTSDFSKIVVVAPKSTFHQFEKTFKYANFTDLKDVSYISIKSSAKVKKVEEAVSPFLEDETDTAIVSQNKLDNSIIIVDEAHNLFNSIANGAATAVDFYDTLMSAKKIKLIFLTGSPIINNLFELVPCFNMLTGVKTFPENQEDFNRLFIKKPKKGSPFLINTEVFKNRIIGLTSYYGEWITEKMEGFPEELPMKIVKLPMSSVQYSHYKSYRDKEMDESKMSSLGTTSDRFGSKKSASSTYRIKSRQASIVIPVENTSDTDLSQKDNSPKFFKILDILKNHTTDKGLIYSDFVNNAGVKLLGRFLELHGFDEWVFNNSATGGKKLKKKTKKKAKNILKKPKTNNTFVIVSGDTSVKDRTEILKMYNSPANDDGSIVRILMLTPAGSEGLNVLGCRFGIITSPYFNFTRVNQVKYRIMRYKSHDRLPIKKRNVQFYLLIATLPTDKTETKKETKKENLSTDEHILAIALQKNKLTLQAYKMLVEASIDCHLHRDKLPKSRQKKINCKLCTPTGEPLWTDNIQNDVDSKDPCQVPTTTSVKAKSLVLEQDGNSIKYMYWTDGDKLDKIYHFSAYDDDMQGWVEIGRNHPHFAALYKKVTKNR